MFSFLIDLIKMFEKYILNIANGYYWTKDMRQPRFHRINFDIFDKYVIRKFPFTFDWFSISML